MYFGTFISYCAIYKRAILPISYRPPDLPDFILIPLFLSIKSHNYYVTFIYYRNQCSIRRKVTTPLDGVAFYPVWVSLFLQDCTSGHGRWFRTRLLSQSMCSLQLMDLRNCKWSGASPLILTCSYLSFLTAMFLDMKTSRSREKHFITHMMLSIVFSMIKQVNANYDTVIMINVWLFYLKSSFCSTFRSWDTLLKDHLVPSWRWRTSQNKRLMQWRWM